MFVTLKDKEHFVNACLEYMHHKVMGMLRKLKVKLSLGEFLIKILIEKAVSFKL